MLGSTLFPAHCVKCSVSVASIDSLTAADCLNNLTSSDANTDLGLDLWALHCPILTCFS